MAQVQKPNAEIRLSHLVSSLHAPSAFSSIIVIVSTSMDVLCMVSGRHKDWDPKAAGQHRCMRINPLCIELS